MESDGVGERDLRLSLEVRRVVDVVEDQLDPDSLIAILGDEVFDSHDGLFAMVAGSLSVALPQLAVALALARAVIVIYHEGEVIGHSLGFEVS